MADYLKRVCRFYGLIALVPLFVGFVGPWSEFIGILLFLSIPIALSALLVGTFRWLDRGDKLPIPAGRRRDRVLVRGLAPVLLVISFFAFLPLFVAGNFLGGFSRLMINRE